jgi:3-isopropylmalate/(R)-2-methylmalate dehydratase large subunit
MSMEERMTICNMSIEGGARCGYVNPDDTTFTYVNGRPHAPKGADWEDAVRRWRGFVSDADASYDDVYELRAEDVPPTVTWGINPGQAIAIHERVPTVEASEPSERASVAEALEYMKLRAGAPIKGTKVDVTFIGSCTNARLSDFREVAKHIRGRRVAPGVKALVVPGSQLVDRAARAEGLDEIFRQAGFEWREAGCSMCLAMNPDKLIDDQLCASSSNRNFKGRQGSSTGRTVLMSPVMVAAAAITGEIADAREVFTIERKG